MRELVTKSAAALTELVAQPCACTLHVTEDFVWDTDLIETLFKPMAAPVFVLKLHVNEEGAYYSTNPDKFEVSL